MKEEEEEEEEDIRAEREDRADDLLTAALIVLLLLYLWGCVFVVECVEHRVGGCVGFKMWVDVCGYCVCVK